MAWGRSCIVSVGEAMSSSEYLESALKTIGKKDVSRAMFECFVDVDCDTLVGPE